MDISWTWLGIAVLAVLIVFCIRGYQRGFVKEVISISSVILAMVLVWFINPYMNGFLRESTPIYEQIEEGCTQLVADQLTQKEEELTRDAQDALIEGLPLPDSLKERIIADNNNQIYQFLSVDSFTEYISEYLAEMLMNGISFLFSYLFAFVLIKIVTALLELVVSIPVLKGMNKAAGIILGGARGLLIIWILLLVLTLLCNTSFGTACMEAVEKDAFLKFLYDKNIFVEIYMSIFYGK